MEESTGCTGKWWGRSTSSFWGQGFTLVWCGGRHLCQWWTLCEGHGFSGLSPLPGFYTLACAQCVWEPRVGRDVYETPLLPRLLREALGIHCKGWYQAATLYHQRWNGCYELFQISRFSMIFSILFVYKLASGCCIWAMWSFTAPFWVAESQRFWFHQGCDLQRPAADHWARPTSRSSPSWGWMEGTVRNLTIKLPLLWSPRSL